MLLQLPCSDQYPLFGVNQEVKFLHCTSPTPFPIFFYIELKIIK